MAACEGGCGGTPASGMFLPGHDQRLRGELERRVGGLLPLRDLVDLAEAYVVGDESTGSFTDRVRRLFASVGRRDPETPLKR